MKISHESLKEYAPATKYHSRNSVKFTDFGSNTSTPEPTKAKICQKKILFISEIVCCVLEVPDVNSCLLVRSIDSAECGQLALHRYAAVRNRVHPVVSPVLIHSKYHGACI